MSGERKRRTHRHLRISRPAMIESLEERQMLTLTIAVTAGGAPGNGGTTSVQATSVGQVVNLEVWAGITDPQALPSEDGLNDVVGSFLSTGVGPGPVAGDLAAAVTSDFSASGSQNGTPQDLNGDGNIDVGSSATVVDDYFFARSSGEATVSNGMIVGNALELEIGTLTYTVTSLNLGGETDINFRPRDTTGVNGAVWVEDGVGGGKNNQTGTFTAGAPFVVTDPALQPAPTAVDDTASTVLNAPVTIDVLANDPATYAALDPSSVKIVATPADGTASPNPDGTIQYIPANGFIGSDSFTYTVNDVNGKTSNAATVTVDTGLGLSSAKGGIKSVTYTDTDGTVATISLNLGQAALAFSGGGGSAAIKGSKATLGGTNTISGITLSGTSKSSTLSITGKGGDGSVSIATITDASPMGKIVAPILNLNGGTSALNGLVSMQVQQINNVTAIIGQQGSTSVTITAPIMNSSEITAAGDTMSFTGHTLNGAMLIAAIPKNFRVTGATTSSTFLFSTAVAAGALSFGDVSSSIFNSSGAFKNLSANSLTSTTLTSGPIAVLHIKGAVTNSSVTFSNATSGAIRVAIGGAVTNSNINSAGTLTAVSAGSLTGSTVTSAGNIVSLSTSSVSGSTILAGTSGVTLDTVTAANVGTATIQKINVAKTFSDSTIIAQTISSASLGEVSNTSGTTQGIGAKTYKSANLNVNGKKVHLASKQLALITALQAALTQQDVPFTPVTTANVDGVAFNIANDNVVLFGEVVSNG